MPADLAIAALVLFAAFAQGVIGFGFGLIVMAVLPRLLGLPEAVATVAVLGSLVSGVLFWRYRRAFDLRAAAPLFLAALVGLPLGVFVLRRFDPDPCIRALGAVIALYAVWSLWPRQAAPAPIARHWAWPAGFFAGLIGGAFATGGPPVIVYATARRFAPIVFRAVLQGFFFATTVVHMGALAAAEILTADVATRALVFIPLVPLGAWFGGRYGDRLHPETFRRAVLVALLLLGASYAWMGR